MQRVSLKDIARMAKVSPSTVSFVLNGKAAKMRISKTVADKIIAVAKKSGYHPNQVAVSLRTGQTKILGLLVEDISNNFFASLARIIEDESKKYGYKVLYCSTENDLVRGRELIRVLSQRQVDGYIIVPTQGMEKDIQQLVAHNKPVVLMDRYFPNVDVPYVLVNNYEGVCLGMEHLLNKEYLKIGFVTVDIDLIQMKERMKGYVNALRARKLPVQKRFILKLRYDLPRDRGVRDIRSFIKKNNDLEAIFFSTNYLGILGLESIKELELEIPRDIAIVCFDDHDIFQLFPPGITAIKQPVEEIARTAIELLMHQLNPGDKKFKKNKFQIAAKFTLRGST